MLRFIALALYSGPIAPDPSAGPQHQALTACAISAYRSTSGMTVSASAGGSPKTMRLKPISSNLLDAALVRRDAVHREIRFPVPCGFRPGLPGRAYAARVIR